MPLTTSLISYWELEEASGTRNDAHGSNHLSDNNTVTQGTGKVGNCADFERDNNEYLSRADNTDLSTGNIDFTFCAWFNLESLPGVIKSTIINKGDGSNGEYTVRVLTDNTVDFIVYSSAGFGGGAAVQAAGAVSAATWYFVVAWHDATADTINIQLNNATPASQALATGVFDSTGPFEIGSYSVWPEPFDGLIDQVGFWKSAPGAGGVLTPQQRTDLYNSGNGLSYAGLTPTATISPTVAAASFAGVAGRMNLGLITPTTTKI